MPRIKRVLSRFLINKFYRKIWVKAALCLVLVVSIPILSLGVLLINRSQKAVKESVLRDRKEIALRAGREIGLFVESSEKIVSAAVRMLEMNYSDIWKQETVLIGLVLDNPIFLNASSVDLSGQKIASSQLGEDIDRSYVYDALQVAAKDKTYISAIRLKGDSHLPYMTMAVPVKRLGKVYAALIADIDFKRMWDVIDGINLGNTTEALLVSNNGTVIAHKDKKLILRNANFLDQLDVEAGLSGESGAMVFKDEKGVRIISAYAPVGASGWAVALRQQERQAYLFSRIMLSQSLIIIVMMEALGVLIAVFIARLFTVPISTLLLKIKNASTNGNEYRINMKRHDEIGELIRAFNDIAHKLKKAKSRDKLSNVGEAAVWTAHELKNSLAPIKSFVQLLPSKYKDNSFMDKFSDIVPAEIKHCERMLRELSDFSAALMLNMDKINVKDILGKLLKAMHDDFTAKKINLHFYAKARDFCVLGDPERIKQVFTNLIVNAQEAMPAGGELRVYVTEECAPAADEEGCIQVSICDTGVGIPKDRLSFIFEPFKTTKREGMGLGLAISRKIIEQHQGRISVETDAGKGTVFTVRLPKANLMPPFDNGIYDI